MAPAPEHVLAARLALVVPIALAGCGSEDGEPALPVPPAPEICAVGQVRLEPEGCWSAGLPPADGCAPGEVELADGSCQPAGVPPTSCGVGFASDDHGGCEPLLPAEPCNSGFMAVPGEASCREVAPCGDGPWGDIPVDAATEHVDIAYGGGSSDGSADHPWTSIQDGIGAAQAGAIVAVAAGSYAEELNIQGKAVQLWGRCPAMVAVVGDTNAALAVRPGADGTVVRSLALSGADTGVEIFGATGVLLHQVWIHDTSGRGVTVLASSGLPSVTMRESLVERATEQAVIIGGGRITVERSVLRDTRLDGTGQFGYGVAAVDQSAARVDQSVVSRAHGQGIYAQGADVTVDSTLVQDTQPTATGELGTGIFVDGHTSLDVPGHAVVARSAVRRSYGAGVGARGADLMVHATTIRDTVPHPVDGSRGCGIDAEPFPLGGQRTNLNVSCSLVERSVEAAVMVLDAEAHLEGVLVRDTAAGSSLAGFGVGVQVGDLTLLGSVVESSHHAGLSIAAAAATVESTIVRDTQPNPHGGFGSGLVAADLDGMRTVIVMRNALLERNHYSGLTIQGSEALLEAVHIRDTRADVETHQLGLGMGFRSSEQSLEPTQATVRWSLIEGGYAAGIVGAGSDVSLESVAVRDVDSQPTGGGFGSGVHVQYDSDAQRGTALTLVASRIEGCRLLGVGIIGAQGTVDNTLVSATDGRASDGLYGDGIMVTSLVESATATVTRSRIDHSARAGIAAFGANIVLEDTELDCNFIHINGEAWPTGTEAFDILDRGGNLCGCAGDAVPCQVVSSNLQPPEFF